MRWSQLIVPTLMLIPYALMGCAPRSTVEISHLVHRGYKPFKEGNTVEFKELSKGVVAVDGRSVLIWEGRYLSPPQRGMARSTKVCILSVTRTETHGTATPQEDTVQVRGFLCDLIGPIARVDMHSSHDFNMAARDASVIEGLLRAGPVVNDNVYVWPDENRTGWTTLDLPDRLRGVKQWDDEHAWMRLHITWPDGKGSEQAAKDILCKYRLRLGPDGDLELKLAE